MTHDFPTTEGRFAYNTLDRVIHEPARLSILTSLLTNAQGLTFNELKQLCTLTDGNLSRHLSVLEQDGLIHISKGHDRKRSQTVCRITPAGQKRFFDHLATLEQIILDASKDAKEQAKANSATALTLSIP